MFKRNKIVYENCQKCGKPLSKREKEKGKPKCESCISTQSVKTKSIVKKVGAGVGTVASIGLFVLTKGKKKL